MGKLRIESKTKGLDPKRYQELLTMLRTAQAQADSARIFYDLDPNEDGNATRKDLMHVAQSEGINVKVHRFRGKRVLQLKFLASPGANKRISAEEARQRILSVLQEADEPLRKGDILKRSKINPGTWNVRIAELTSKGMVKRSGVRRDTVYSLT